MTHPETTLKSSYYPEPDTEPEEDYCAKDSKGCEVYAGESLYIWEKKKICPDCFKDKVRYLMENDLEYLAAMMDVDYEPVRRKE